MKFLFENMKGHRVMATIPPYVPWMIRSHEGQNSVRLSLEVGGCSLVTLLDSSWLTREYSEEEYLSAFSDIVESVNHMIDKMNNVINLTAIAEKRLPLLKRLPMSEADDDDIPVLENPRWHGKSASYVWHIVLSNLDDMNEAEKLAIFSGVTARFNGDVTDDVTTLYLHVNRGFICDLIKVKYLTPIKRIIEEAFNDSLDVVIIEEYGYI